MGNREGRIRIRFVLHDFQKYLSHIRGVLQLLDLRVSWIIVYNYLFSINVGQKNHLDLGKRVVFDFRRFCLIKKIISKNHPLFHFFC